MNMAQFMAKFITPMSSSVYYRVLHETRVLQKHSRSVISLKIRYIIGTLLRIDLVSG